MEGPSRRRLRALNPSNYEIFDEDFSETGEVLIWSRSPLPPHVGDRFNIETSGDLHDLAVGEIRTFAGGWTAICRAPRN